MRVVAITPVGPGHERVSLECDGSTKRAWAHSKGPFTSLSHFFFDDTQGKFGRSRARNMLVGAHRAEWYLFIDADDICDKHAFGLFGAALSANPELIAVFGAVCTDRSGVIGENKYPLNWSGLLKHAACGTLSMGCFVRSDVAFETPFNESMDAAEDFDFYLRLLRGRSWVKIKEPLVMIRTQIPSATGPRGYTSLDWRGACQRVVDQHQ